MFFSYEYIIVAFLISRITSLPEYNVRNTIPSLN